MWDGIANSGTKPIVELCKLGVLGVGERGDTCFCQNGRLFAIHVKASFEGLREGNLQLINQRNVMNIPEEKEKMG